MLNATEAYCGRFAPSPTGPLHFGSLVAAVGSFVDARAHGGAWLVRMEDLDPPRFVPGAAGDILRALEACALHWDGEVVYQSARHDAYAAALQRLADSGATFECACTRKEIADSALGPDGAAIYPGTCRHGLPPGRNGRAIRVRVNDAPIVFHDRLQGERRHDLAREVGDFVVRRADGVYAYQLAVAVDDAYQGMTDIVRGADLLDSTPRQIHLQHLLGLPTPRYLHLPVATNAQGEKLSKQTLAAPVDASHASECLIAALSFLGHRPPAALHGAVPDEVLQWAIANWNVAHLPRVRYLPHQASA